LLNVFMPSVFIVSVVELNLVKKMSSC
jgi:hypothetical protein